MGFTYTTNLTLAKPDYNEPGANWWPKINNNFDLIDAAFGGLSTVWTDRTTYIDPGNATSEFCIGDSGQLTEPTLLIKKLFNTTVAIPDPTLVTGDYAPMGNIGGHVGLFCTTLRETDSSGYNCTPYFFALKDKAVQDGQLPLVANWINWAGGSGGTGCSVFCGWDMLIGHTSGTGRLIGREINVQEARSDQGFYYSHLSGNNWSCGLLCAPETTFESKTGRNCTWAIFITDRWSGSPKWNCGIRFGPGAVVHGLTYASYFTGSYPLGIALQLEKRQCIRWCQGTGPGIAFSHAYYYPLITGDDWGQFIIMLTPSYWWRFTNVGTLQYSSTGGAVWTTMAQP